MLSHLQTPSANSDAVDAGGVFEPESGLPRASFPVPERAVLPKPERLNRNALTVVAVVMGVMVLAAVVFVQPKSATGPSQEVRSTPEAAHGTFLDQPSTGVAAGVVPDQPNMGGAAAPSFDQRGGTAMPSETGGSSYGGYSGAFNSRPYAGPYATDGPASASIPVVIAPHATDPRAQAYRAALEAPLVASEVAVVASPAAAVSTGADMANVSEYGVDAAATGNGGARPFDMGAISRRALSPGGARGTNATMIRTSVNPAPGPYALQAGTLIPAVLMTEINSDLPGEVLAQVSRDVYDSRSEQTLLVPRGSRLIGKYDNQIAAGQNRLLVAWTRVIFPDGRSISLPGLETKDRAGAGGLHDQVDQHKRRTFGAAALLSLISAGAQLSQPNGGYGAWGSYPSSGQIAAGAVGQQLSEVATQMLRRNMDAQPTIRIRQGIPFNVFLNADMVFPAPYRSSYSSSAFGHASADGPR